MKGIRVEDGQWGPRAIFEGPWSDGIKEFICEHDIKEIYLNKVWGWSGEDLDFLINLKHLEWFKIIDHSIDDVRGVHELENLRELSINTYCKTPVSFDCFPKLENCFLEWRPKSESVFSCTTLKRLYINCYKGRDTDSFAALTNLEFLAFGNGPVSELSGLSALAKLKHLEIFLLRKLETLSGLDALQELEVLRINTCRRVRSVDPLAGLTNLHTLDIDNMGDIASLHPLMDLQKLERFGFIESTNIVDGDLNVLCCLSSLKRAWFQNRRHYSHSREELAQLLEEK